MNAYIKKGCLSFVTGIPYYFVYDEQTYLNFYFSVFLCLRPTKNTYLNFYKTNHLRFFHYGCISPAKLPKPT